MAIDLIFHGFLHVSLATDPVAFYLDLLNVKVSILSFYVFSPRSFICFEHVLYLVERLLCGPQSSQ